MKSMLLRATLAGCTLAAMTLVLANDASAQCATYPTATVAYAPVAAQAAVSYRPYTGWYPGKWLDQWRMSRAGVAAAPTYSAAYAPSYTTANYPAANYPAAGYAPSYTASYAPTYRQTAYRPYVTAYAPLSVPVAASCSTCTQVVARPVLMRPVVVASACNTCSYTPNCACNACSTGLTQAAYTDTGCSSCGVGASPDVMPSGNVGQQTPKPQFERVPDRATSQYESQRQIGDSDSHEGHGHGAEKSKEEEFDPLKNFDPGTTKDADSTTYNNAPRLLDPRDRTASRRYNSRKPTVKVWTAVNRQASPPRNAIRTSTRRARTQEEIDADGWSAVPNDR